MRHSDSLDKIVGVYLAALCRKPFTYKKKTFQPKQVYVSPLLLRGYTCPASCGACCGSFSLDYIPHEATPTEASSRSIRIDQRDVMISSDLQADVSERWCRNLEQITGRCKIYERRPLSCDFELIRILNFQDRAVLIQKQYGRAWAMERLDGEKGALCEMLPPEPFTVAEVDRKLARLEGWATYLGVPTCISEIRQWIVVGNCDDPLIIQAK